MINAMNPSSSQQNLAASQRLATTAPGMELESMRALGINPSHALQHPGFYYYMAARCTEMRRDRFLAALEIEVWLLSLTLADS